MRNQELNKLLDQAFVSDWIDEKLTTITFPIKQNGKTIDNQEILPEQATELLKCYNTDEKDQTAAKFISVLSKGKKPLSITKIKSGYKDFPAQIFAINKNEIEKNNIKYARLCFDRNIIESEELLPSLTLGTVIKCHQTKNKYSYLLCIQQRCDSTRILPNEERRFLFLTLKEIDRIEDGFDYVTKDNIKLKLDNNSYNLRTVKFKVANEGIIQGIKQDDKIWFQPIYDNSEKFEYVFELKEMYAQRIVDEYTSTLSRIGIDEPEWVRRSKR